MRTQNDSGKGPKQIHILEVLGNAIVGGMEKYVYNLIRWLPASRFRITCLCPYESNFTTMLREMDCPVYVAPMLEDPPWRSIQTAVEIVRCQQVDLIHAHLPKAHVLAGLAGALNRRPAVATIHGMSLTTQELGISRTTGTYLTVVCQEAYFQALAMGVPPERVTKIPNGVDTTTFTPAGDRETFRQSLGIPLDVSLVGFVGRLAWEKGPDQFIHAAYYISRQRPDTHFVLVGEGPMEAELRQMAQEYGLEAQVHLAGLRTDVHQVYPALDVLAQTSRVEGMPFTLLEAMACGLPAVAIAVGGVAELVVVGQTGLLAGVGDWEAVGNGVLELLQDPAKLKVMGQAARGRAEKEFDLQRGVGQVGDLFSKLVKAYTGRPQLQPAPWPVPNGLH